MLTRVKQQIASKYNRTAVVLIFKAEERIWKDLCAERQFKSVNTFPIRELEKSVEQSSAGKPSIKPIISIRGIYAGS